MRHNKLIIFIIIMLFFSIQDVSGNIRQILPTDTRYVCTYEPENTFGVMNKMELGFNFEADTNGKITKYTSIETVSRDGAYMDPVLLDTSLNSDFLEQLYKEVEEYKNDNFLCPDRVWACMSQRGGGGLTIWPLVIIKQEDYHLLSKGKSYTTDDGISYVVSEKLEDCQEYEMVEGSDGTLRALGFFNTCDSLTNLIKELNESVESDNINEFNKKKAKFD